MVTHTAVSFRAERAARQRMPRGAPATKGGIAIFLAEGPDIAGTPVPGPLSGRVRFLACAPDGAPLGMKTGHVCVALLGMTRRNKNEAPVPLVDGNRIRHGDLMQRPARIPSHPFVAIATALAVVMVVACSPEPTRVVELPDAQMAKTAPAPSLSVSSTTPAFANRGQ